MLSVLMICRPVYLSVCLSDSLFYSLLLFYVNFVFGIVRYGRQAGYQSAFSVADFMHLQEPCCRRETARSRVNFDM